MNRPDTDPRTVDNGAVPEVSPNSRLPTLSVSARWTLSASARWTLAALVVVVALLIAIWPREQKPSEDTVNAGPEVSATTRPQPPGALAEARRRAALDPCLTGQVSARSRLSGIRATCLGNGASVDMAAITDRRPTVINMWASWCAPCREELPLIQNFARQADGRVTVITVHARDGAANQLAALDLLHDLGVRLPAVLDADGRIAAALGVPPGLPCTVLLSADGTVVRVLPGAFTSVAAMNAAVGDYLDVAL